MAKRVALPIVLLLCGIGSFIYGALFHTLTVYEETKTEISIPIPTPFGRVIPFEEPPLSEDPSPFEPVSPVDEQALLEGLAEPGHAVPSEVVNPFESPFDGKDRQAGSENPFEAVNPFESPFDGKDRQAGSENPFETDQTPRAIDPSENPFGGEDPTSETSNPFSRRSAEADQPRQAAKGPSAGGEQSPFEANANRGGKPPLSLPPPGGSATDLPVPLGPLEPMVEKVTEIAVVPREEPEWVIVRDVSVGGVTRLASGVLKRTYSGKPPALCPT